MALPKTSRALHRAIISSIARTMNAPPPRAASFRVEHGGIEHRNGECCPVCDQRAEADELFTTDGKSFSVPSIKKRR